MSDPAADSVPDWTAPLGSMRDPELKASIIGLFRDAREHIESVSNSNENILVVLISRRFSCIYTMLLDAGMPRLDQSDGCEVVFDRALDGKLRWEGKHILVLDDMVVFGRTIADRVEALERAFGESMNDVPEIKSLVAACHKNASNRHLIDAKIDVPSDAERLTDEENDVLSEDLSYCLYRSVTPYFTDFPVIGTGTHRNNGLVVSVSEEAFSQLRRTEHGWLCADVTVPPPIGLANQYALTYIPDDDVARIIKNSLVPAAHHLAELMKVRLFISCPDDSGIRILRAVPIGIPGPASSALLDECLGQIADSLPGWSIADWQQWKPQGKHRLVQAYISTAVLAAFWKHRDLKSLLGSALSSQLLDADHIAGYYERDCSDNFCDTFDAIVKSVSKILDSPSKGEEAADPDSTWNAPTFRACPQSPPYQIESLQLDIADKCWKNRYIGYNRLSSVPKRPKDGECTKVDPFWAHGVLNLWAIIVKEHQHNIQKCLLDLDETSSTESRSSLAAWYDRVRCGFLPNEVATALLGPTEESDAWSQALISLVFDIGNDLGIAVPSTHNQAEHEFGGNMVYRQYRAGENAHIADNRPRDVVTSDITETRQTDEDAFGNLDSLSQRLLNIEIGTGWDDLEDAQRRDVEKLIEDYRNVEDHTTQSGTLTGARVATVVAIDDNAEYIDAIVEGPSSDNSSVWMQFPLKKLSHDVRQLIIEADSPEGVQFMWYTVEPASSTTEQVSGTESRHSFESLANSGQ